MSMSMPPNANATTAPAVDGTLLIEAASRWPVAATALFACAVAFLLQTLFKNDPWASIPLVGAELGGQESRRRKFMNGEARNMYLEGYKKFKEQAFRITTARKSPNIVVAPKFMDELKRLPDDVLSFNRAIEESLHSKYTGVETNIEMLPHTVKTALTPALVRLNPIISDEVVEAMRTELPQSGEWTEVKILEKLRRVVAMASGRVFIGPELCRNEEYLDAAINYTVDLMKAIFKVADMTPYMRPFLAPRTPEVRRVRARIAEAEEFLRPVVRARREAARDPDYRKPDDMLEWFMESQKKFGQRDDSELARYQLGISFAAIHTTTSTVTNALYTLAAMPELVPVLREDVQRALAETNGVFTSSAMQNMKKVDSFLKETMRYYLMGPTSFQRKVLKTFTLSNGQVIPAGSVIELPAIGINTDDDFFPDARSFDALRFYKMRKAKTEQETGTRQAEVVANAQFVSVGQTSLTFGYGRHACPGRFFAVNEIKMIMATLLANYDLMNVGGSRERYPNVEAGSTALPDPDRTILLKKL
ncbi:Ent-kaurene oxidase [Colletotrichum tanaceti]|uniref:Ent-kaurene oxidase n=1 Tax=Colletotrichum tanaceti TaxID=1306861 RepID=A0A4U6X255_9PEZI|nr:Ent-kaurene oxidase [Colletotrichum tanaceti]